MKYNVSERGNPLSPQEPKKWYAATRHRQHRHQSTGQKIAQCSTVSTADTQACWWSSKCWQNISRRERLSVRMISGHFKSAQAAKVWKRRPFNASMIKTKKVAFRPGAELKTMLNNLKFEKL
ncbi:MAG: hypothetical protein LBK03_04110 [Bacteroidales bacterium]|nr:hypothetical protein [Bacteroidales bacterium]